MSLGMFSKTIVRVTKLSTSVTYAQSNLVMIVPPGKEKSAFHKLFTAFDETLWYTLSGLMLVVVFIILILTKCQRRRDVRDFVLGRENRNPFLNIVNVTVGLGFAWHQLPKRNFSRWILTMFLLMWLIIRSLYQAVLYKNLQATERNLPVQSIKESLELDFVYFMLLSTKDNIVYLPEVYDRRVIVTKNQSNSIIAETFFDPNAKAAFLGGEDVIKYANKMNLYGNVKKVEICPESFMLRQFSIFYPQNSYLKTLFDVELLRLVDAGLIDYWKKNVIESIPEKISKVPRKITILHLLSAFELLSVGIGIALITFIVELISLRVDRVRKLFMRS